MFPPLALTPSRTRHPPGWLCAYFWVALRIFLGGSAPGRTRMLGAGEASSGAGGRRAVHRRGRVKGVAAPDTAPRPWRWCEGIHSSLTR